MDLGAVVDLARDRLADPQARYWSQAELVSYVNLGQEELARRGLVLRETTTITIEADKLDYDFPANTLDILHMQRRGNATPITRRSSHQLTRKHGDWRGRTGVPRHFVTDRNTKGFTLFRVPDAADITANGSTLDVILAKLPAQSLTWEDDADTELELPGEYHFDVVEYMRWRALEKAGEARNETKATEAMESFFARANQARRETVQRYYAPGSNTSLRRYYG